MDRPRNEFALAAAFGLVLFVTVLMAAVVLGQSSSGDEGVSGQHHCDDAPFDDPIWEDPDENCGHATATPAPPTATPCNRDPLTLECLPPSVPDTATPVPDTATPVPDTATPVPDTATPVPDTATPIPDTATPIPDTATPIPPSLAPAPSGLQVDSLTRTTITLSWAIGDDVHGYKVEYRRGTSGGWTTYGGASGASEFVDDGLYKRKVTGLDCGTTYQFRVSGRGDGSPYSTDWGSAAQVSGTTAACSTAPTPTGLSVTALTRTSVRVSWDSITDVYRYKLERSRDGLTWREIDDNISGTSYDTGGLVCNTLYHFRVSARGDGSPYLTSFGLAASAVGKPLGCPTAPAPTGLSVDASTQTTIRLVWTDDGLENRVEYRTGGGSWTAHGAGASGTGDDETHLQTESRTITGLACGTSYDFRVSAKGDGSPYSTDWGSTAEVSGSTAACPSSPTATATPTPTATATPTLAPAPTGLSADILHENRRQPELGCRDRCGWVPSGAPRGWRRGVDVVRNQRDQLYGDGAGLRHGL